MEDKIVTLKYYETVIEAEVDMDVLKNNGIECAMNSDSMLGLYPIFDEKERGLKLLVFEKDFEKATLILENYHSASPVE